VNRNWLLSLLLGVFLSLSCLFSDTASAIIIKSEEYDSLESGNVIQKSLTAQLRGNLKGTESKILINAPNRKVWEVLDDKENLPKFIRQVKKADIVEEKNEQQKVAATVKLCDLLPSFNYLLVFDRSEKFRRMKFKKVGGAFKELYGYFEIIPYQDKTILAYRIYSDPGFYIPEFIGKALRGDATKIMRSIKTEAEK
jgi:ribosome-associated toxin RatA of RatAB toxin-antitoxin module